MEIARAIRRAGGEPQAMRDIVKACRRPKGAHLRFARATGGGFPHASRRGLSGGVAHGSRCPASPRHALLAENLGKPSPWVIISETWYRYRPGARFGPRAIREASTLFSFGHAGVYDFEDDVTYLPEGAARIVDIGDADIIHTDTIKSHDNIEFGVRKILRAGAIPLVLGGDHSVHIPCMRAFDGEAPVHLIHIDAHLDFVDSRHGVLYGHGNPLRRASEMKHVSGMTQLGIRYVSSSNKADYEAARAAGSDILSVRHVRDLGTEGVLARIPAGARYYCTIDIDGFDPSIAPGTGTPSHGGFLYYEVLELLQGLTKRGEVVGIDLVEVAPDYDTSGITSFLAAQLLLSLIGYMFHEGEAG